MKRLRSIVLAGLMAVFAVTGAAHAGEYGARDHFQGDYFGLNFAIKF